MWTVPYITEQLKSASNERAKTEKMNFLQMYQDIRDKAVKEVRKNASTNNLVTAQTKVFKSSDRMFCRLHGRRQFLFILA